MHVSDKYAYRHVNHGKDYAVEFDIMEEGIQNRELASCKNYERHNEHAVRNQDKINHYDWKHEVIGMPELQLDISISPPSKASQV